MRPGIYDNLISEEVILWHNVKNAAEEEWA